MTDFFETDRGYKIAYNKSSATAEGNKLPGVIFMGGFRSDKEGSKALYLEEQCKKRGQAFIRFDYAGHGQSGGKFTDGTIGQWTQDCLDILDHVADPKRQHILIGSSMGGWLMLLTAIQRSRRTAGLVGIAAAPDFTEDLMLKRMPLAMRDELFEKGFVTEPNEYSDEPYIITKKLIEDGREHLLLRSSISIHCPVRLIQGRKDTSVPAHWADKIRNQLMTEDIKIIYIEDGDHSLSRESDLPVIDHQIRQIIGTIQAQHNKLAPR